MTPLPVVSARKALRVFRELGYDVDHQTGSHIILRHSEQPHRRLTLPNHREIAKGTLRALIRQSGVTVEEFTLVLRRLG